MIQITKGNPTPEEIAALVAVLALAGATTRPGPTCSTAAGWRRSGPRARLNPAELSRRVRGVVSCWPGARPGTAPGPLGRDPQRRLTPDSWARTCQHVVSPQTSSDRVEHPSCWGLLFWSVSVVAVHGAMLGAMGSSRK
jgi:hypothetical protein